MKDFLQELRSAVSSTDKGLTVNENGRWLTFSVVRESSGKLRVHLAFPVGPEVRLAPGGQLQRVDFTMPAEVESTRNPVTLESFRDPSVDR